MTFGRSARLAAMSVVGTLSLPLVHATAQGPQPPEPSAWWLGSGFGYASAGGSYGDVLGSGALFDVTIGRGAGGWRFGGGFQFGGLGMKPPYDNQLEWARLEVFGSVKRLFRSASGVRPYLELRPGIVRMQSRSELFYDVPPDVVAEGRDATPESDGLGLTVRSGVEIELATGFSLDVASSYSTYRTRAYDLTPIQMSGISKGSEWGLRVGASWRPLWPGTSRSPASSVGSAPMGLDLTRDAWGVPRSWGWAAAEILAINFSASMLNTFVRDESTWPVTPQSFETNLKRGWRFDDNKFGTNQLIHPFNGSSYFNSARSNGIGFWGSSAMAIAGAFLWECCGETQHMSWNDMLSTGLGGVSAGEVAYRTSSLVLDNTARGKERLWREVAGTLVDPFRGLNRLLSGSARRVHENPVDPHDRRPPRMLAQASVGVRTIGQGESITDHTNRYGFAEFTLIYGDPFEQERRRPFDRFDAYMQVNAGDQGGIGRVQVRGDLWSKPVGDTSTPFTRHSLAVVHDFDYIDNEAYKFGGQGLGLALFSRFGSFERRFITRFSVTGILGAAVNADYSFEADVPGDRGVRDYDYGTGLGFNFEGLVFEEARMTARADYRYTLMNVVNGSLADPTTGIFDFSSDARHQVHRAGVEVLVAISDNFAVGFQSNVFFRNSDYDSPELVDRFQNNPELKIYVTRLWR